MSYTKQEQKDYIEASTYYLTEELPKDFHKWTDKKLDQFIENHLWKPFEYEEIDTMWDHISQLARGIRNYISKENNKSNVQSDTKK